jgi:FtsZ-binding cell division protein ZapB
MQFPNIIFSFFLTSQILQHEIREMQININRLNKDVVDLTQDADENLARRLREEMRELNESWSHIISSTKLHSQSIQVRKYFTLNIPNNLE